MKTSIEINTKQLITRIQARQSAMKTNSPQLNEAFLRIGLQIQSHARINATNKGIVDTGTLRQQINYKFFNDGNQSGVMIGVFGIPYAAINEFGGTVTRDMLKAMFATNRNRQPKASKNVIKIGKGAQSGTWRARPYLIPAFRSQRTFITNQLAMALGLK
jgi:phage gpG-like protein